jgi:hypothetical protein
MRTRAVKLGSHSWAALGAVTALALCIGIVWPAPRPALAQSEGKLWQQPQGEVDRKSHGCITCHTKTDSASMHPTETVHLGCVDCHGGNPEIELSAEAAADSPAYRKAKWAAHVHSSLGPDASGGANPVRAYGKWMKESAQYIQFVNPGDLRVTDQTCGMSGCHVSETRRVRSNMMTTGAMLWGAALYNNGAFPHKDPHFGESYDRNGTPQRLQTWPAPSAEETRTKGVLPFLEPLERWEVSQPGNVLRAFERGGKKRPEIGNPISEEEPGKPDFKLSDRGFGTLLRTDPVFLGLQKTRLFDPLLSFPGTNDQPGDYRGSGCTGCHVVYANDRDPAHAAAYAEFGNEGKSVTSDPTINKQQSGHPLRHVFTKSIPSSQCMVCHMHPGTNMVASYFGYTFWDNEVDAEHMYPAKEHDPSQEEMRAVSARNPETGAARGLWADVEFLKKVGTPEFNRQLRNTQFADFHSHGWIFRAVFKRNRKGDLLDENGQVISAEDPQKFKKAVQLKDIHLEKGMHCIDCHFEQDAHGNGKLYGEPRAAIEIGCADCHGSISKYADLVTTGLAAPEGGTNLAALRTPWKQERFYRRDGHTYQRSVVEQGKEWEVVQVKDVITPGNPHYSEKARLAKTIQRDGFIWGAVPDDLKKLAHGSDRMTCFACHSSWTTSCFGCHLSMTANQRKPMIRNEGLMTRNWTSYNFQVLRDDVYMLGIDGTVTGHKVAPVRSACAIIVSSQNQNRDWIYYGQQPLSAEGFSGEAFSPYVPHTVRAKETKTCTDCHVSANGDNNAWMAQVMVEGTNFVNYLGRFAYVATGKSGFEAVGVLDRDEPEAIIGSDFYQLAFPSRFASHQKRKLELKEAYEHHGEVLDLQLRGEYVYAATGAGGLRVFDVSNIDNKDFSERVTTAPVSPVGQQLYVKTKYAAAVASPSTLALDPTRKHFPENEEQSIHPMYAFLYVADKYEGLVIVGDARPNSSNPGVATLLDGEPRNNFLRRALAFNPDGALNGARRITIAGTYAYILCDAGLVVMSLEDPLHPRITSQVASPELKHPRGIAVQFRYAFVVDDEGLKVLDVTHLDRPKLVPGASVAIEDARNVTVSREYALVAAGKQGMVIVDVEKPEHPVTDQTFNAGGELNDTNDIKVGMVSSSQFALVADGKNGLKVVQLFSPQTTPNFYGFSPRLAPKLIARYQTDGPALAVSRGVDRDRAVDESGNQLAVFGRRGARPFNLQEMQRMFLREGKLYTVTDSPPGPAQH